MISPLFLAALSLVAADLAGDLSAVSASAAGLSSNVAGWSSGDGLSGALVIQQNYDPLSKAVVALDSSAGSASQDDAVSNADGISALSSSVSGLLTALAEKAQDFSAVGASDIVKNDLNGLSQPSADIISKLAAAAGDQVPQGVADAANSLAAAFSSAIQAFGANAVEFPNVSAGSGGSASSGGAESSAPASSGGAESSAPASSGGAAGSAAPTQSKGGAAGSTDVVEQTVVETVCTHESCTGVAPANGGVANGAILGGVAAAFAALL